MGSPRSGEPMCLAGENMALEVKGHQNCSGDGVQAEMAPLPGTSQANEKCNDNADFRILEGPARFSPQDDENPTLMLSPHDNPNQSLELGDNPDVGWPSTAGVRIKLDVDLPNAEGLESEGSHDITGNEGQRRAARRLLVLLCAVSCIEGLDGAGLNVNYYALQKDLGLSLTDLATMNLCQAICGALFGPFWGILADRGVLTRKTILTAGCICQGLTTLVLAFVDSYPAMVVLRSANAAVLSSLKPVSVGIVATVASEENRGKAFGWVQVAAITGSIVGGLIGTPLSNKQIMGWDGWRVVFVVFGSFATLIGLIVSKAFREPGNENAKLRAAGKQRSILQEVCRLVAYMRMPTFCVIVIQGIFGCIPGNALGYTTLFYQVSGLTDVQASMISSLQQVSTALGMILGGIIGDAFSRRCRMHGRPLAAQISVGVSIPIVLMQFGLVPAMGAGFKFESYLALAMAFGLFTTWCGVGVNWPILSEIVSADNRSAIMAWEAALEGASAAVFGNAAVGFLAEKVYGYDLHAGSNDSHADPASARALGKALLFTAATPFVVCFCFYSLLHWSYPRDLRRVWRRQEKAAAAAAATAAATAASSMN